MLKIFLLVLVKFFDDPQRQFAPKYIENTFEAIYRVLLAALEMHFKPRYKICICSVILGQLSKLEGLQYYFPKMQFNVLRKWEVL